MPQSSEIEWAEVTMDDALAELAAYRAVFWSLLERDAWRVLFEHARSQALEALHAEA